MIAHVQQSVRRKISDFIHLEDGRVGNRNALTTAAIITSSVFAGLILAPKTALAVACSCYEANCQPPLYCCWLVNLDCPSGVEYHCNAVGGHC